ncbi:hypothetical protein [Amorphus sp. 3PC139-8]|uniref:hypothetical protein n=1 Tax=Amorphus sp. 3PC139-8 TaxID=2735676 RepID=UPI00345D5D53
MPAENRFDGGFFPPEVKDMMDGDTILMRVDAGVVSGQPMIYDVVSLDTFGRFPEDSVQRFFSENKVLCLETDRDESVAYIPAKAAADGSTSPFLRFVGEHIASGTLPESTRAVAGPELAEIDGRMPNASPLGLTMIDRGALRQIPTEIAIGRIRQHRAEVDAGPDFSY